MYCITHSRRYLHFALLENAECLLLYGIFGWSLSHLLHLILVLPQLIVQLSDFFLDGFRPAINLRARCRVKRLPQ